MSEPERKRQSPEFRRRQILDAARDVLLKDPDASVQDIADAAGLTRQLVGIYFPGGGTGPIFAALFEDFAATIPNFLSEGIEAIEIGRPDQAVRLDQEALREAIATVINAFFDWAEGEVREPWIFSSGRDRPGSGIGARWDSVQGSFADTLIALSPNFAGSPKIRIALLIEQEGFASLLEKLLTGAVSRDDAFRIATERFFALYTVVLPALAD